MKRILIFIMMGLVSNMALCATALAENFDAPFIAPSSRDTPFNRISQVACESCYQKRNAPTFTTVFDSIRAVHLDVWDQRNGSSGGSAKHWFVRPEEIVASGNDNNCTGDGAGTNDLEACLKDIKGWSDKNPQHFPITIIIHKEQGWSKESAQRTPKDFDELLGRIFLNTLFTPRDLVNYIYPGNNLISPIQTSIVGKDWPTAMTLSGKVIVVLTDGQNQDLSQYADTMVADAKAFVAPITNGQNDITGAVSGMSRSASNWVVMNNMIGADSTWAQQVYANSHIGQVYYDTGVSFDRRIAERAHLPAYDDFVSAGDSNGYRIRPF
ncbi:Ca2+-dependent phosphoinositide-specific phospholipase C [Burkholderia sp. Bp8986]|uniref:Ca2+-dependent phosphoinositide-specific phospholipase C n=1 Tax=Burkholderia sp. Bp8986 TaxID=2184550 RepID=UPI000F5A8C07|nr:Ca2+-dependent phosphoinositide-specific phospholipase C [Burkholderia sp. Bp8986]RQS42917.1 hypothetical protein DID99_35485 [Burkholderia sp. Bp8986]